jgi:hypothetical protein
MGMASRIIVAPYGYSDRPESEVLDFLLYFSHIINMSPSIQSLG